MKKYYIDEANSTIDYIILQDDKGNMYEYQTDTNVVLIINRYDGDIGEELNNSSIADEIRKFCQCCQ